MVKPNLGTLRSNFRIVLAKKEVRDGRRYSYRDISAQTGVSTSTIVEWSSDTAKNFGRSTLAALCNFFECQPGDLLEYIPPAEEAKE